MLAIYKFEHVGIQVKDIDETIKFYNPNLPTEGKVHHKAFAVENIAAEIAR